MALESWEIMLFQLSVGNLITGFLLCIFSIFTAGIHFGHGGRGAHLGHSIHLRMGRASRIGHLFHIKHGGRFSKKGRTHLHSKHQSKAQENPETPIMLILSAFLLMSGAIGTVIYKIEVFSPLIRVLLIILIPLIFVKIVAIAWNKIVKNEHGIEIPVVSVDNQVKTLTRVDDQGGLVLADTGNLSQPDTLHAGEKMKMQAKTLTGVSIERDSIAYIIDIDQKNTLIIDLWPKQAKKDRTLT